MRDYGAPGVAPGGQETSMDGAVCAFCGFWGIGSLRGLGEKLREEVHSGLGVRFSSARTDRLIVILRWKREIIRRRSRQICDCVRNRVGSTECDDNTLSVRWVRDGNVATRVAEKGAGIPGRNQLEAGEFTTSTETLERWLDAGGTDAVGYVDDAGEFFK